MKLTRISLLVIPFTGMVCTEVILLYSLKNFNLITLGELYMDILEFLVAFNLNIQPNLFFNFVLSLILLIPLFFILKYIKTPFINFQKEPVLHFVARTMLYGFTFITNSFLLGRNSYIAIVPYIYFITLAVKFYEHYSLADLGFHARDLFRNCGIGILFFVILEIPPFYVVSRLTTVYQVSTGETLFVFLLYFSIFLPNSIFEELFFRGYVQTHITRLTNAGTGIFIQAVLSGVIHILTRASYNPVYFLTVLLSMMIFGYLYYKKQSLVPGIVMHTLHNGIVGLYMLMNTGLVYHGWILWFLLQVGIVLLLFVVYHLFGRNSVTNDVQ